MSRGGVVPRLAVRQISTNLPRVAAIFLATAIGTAFVAACFVYSASVRAGVASALTGGLDRVDVVVTLEQPGPFAATVERAAAVEGVEAAYPADSMSADAVVDGHPLITSVTAYVNRNGTRPELVSGTVPTGAQQAALSELSAARSGLSVGDALRITAPGDTTRSVDLTITGIVADTNGNADVLRLVAPVPVLAALDADAYRLLVYANPGADPAAVLTALQAAFPGASVATGAQVAAEESTGASSSVDALFVALAAFAAVAVFVLILVVRNTFTVLIGQRARQLALLRCIGASRRTVRMLTLTEAAILGLTAGVVGALMGVGGTAVVLSAVGTGTDELLPTEVAIPALAFIVPTVLGLVVTLVAALGPARLASRLRPVEALAPYEVQETARGTRRGVLILAVLAVLGGTVLMVGGAYLDLYLSIVGGAVSALGALALCAAAAPTVAHRLGRVITGRGVPGRLATVNVVRNPGRTKATVSALIVGVGLITMLSVGARSVGSAADDQVEATWPVDATVTGVQGLDPGLQQRLEQVEGVGTSAALVGVPATVAGGSAPGVGLTVLRGDAEAVRMLPPSQRPEPGTIVVPNDAATSLGVIDGSTLTLSAGSATVTVTVRLVPFYLTSGASPAVLAAPADVTGVSFPAAPVVMWLDATGPEDVSTMTTGLSGVVGLRSDLSVISNSVTGERFSDAIATLLLVSSALIGIAVLIALVGVGNTMSQAVFERRREIGVLRALGMSRASVARSVHIEAAILAGTGALVGLVVGTAYGYAGAWAMSVGTSLEVGLDVPWLTVSGLLVAAVLAGLVAAALPARTAARLHPTSALAAS